MSYLTEVVLPSVDFPVKSTYNMKEACRILDCHYKSLALLVGKGELKITRHKKVYFRELEMFFEKNHEPKAPE